MNIYLILGIIWSALLLLAFFMEQIHKWKDDDLIFDVVNFVGSMLLVIYAVDGDAYPFIILNSVWAIISLRDIFRDLRK